MMMAGFFEIVILMAMTSSFGIPVGLPPAAEEPFMYNVAPEKCLYFTTWATMADADPESDNLTERMIAEKEIVAFIKKLDQAFQKMVASGTIETNSDEENLIASAMPDIARTLLTRATTVYLDGFELRGEQPHVSGGLVLSLGPNEKKIGEHVLNIQKALAEDAASEVEIGGKSFYQIPIPEGENVITWGIHAGRLLFTLGEGSMEKLLDNAETPAPAWLVKQKADLKVERISSVSYVDLQEIIRLLRAAGEGEGEAAFMFDMLGNFGLDNFKSYRCVAGLEGQGVVERTKVEFDGKRRGLMAAIGKAAFDEKALNKLPKDPLVAIALKIDPQQIYQMIDENPQMIGFFDRATFESGIEQIEDVISGSFEEDLIGSLGDTIYIYTSPNDGGLLTGWTLAIDVKQSMVMDQIIQRVVGFAKAAMMVGGGDAPVKIRNQTVQGNEVYYVQFEDSFMPFSPSWSLVNDQLLFSLYPQAIKGHIARQKLSEGLADNPAVKALLAANADRGNSCVLTYTDMSEVIKFGYPFLIGAYSAATQFGGAEEFDLDPIDFPSVASLTKHMGPSATLVRSTDTEFSSESRHVMPSGSIGATVPAMGAITMPAVFAARAAARRTMSANNLKQIGLGLHNYHDTYRGLPAPYTLDKNGKPLLSWRVHILPFIEQQALYDQFHFDEPWDSEHNKTLIEQMPATYLIPGGDATLGKTVYLGVGGESGIFGSERAKDKGKFNGATGTNFGMVSDGTSNTIMVVEANQTNAATWTKPDDFDAPEMSPLKRLVGNWKGGFQVLFGDGSVQFLPEDIDVDTLQNMFQMDDGKVIDRDFRR